MTTEKKKKGRPVSGLAAELRRCALIMAKRGISAERDAMQDGVGEEWKANLEGQAQAYEAAAKFLDKRADRMAKRSKKR